MMYWSLSFVYKPHTGRPFHSMALGVFVSWILVAMALFSKETAISVAVINLVYDFSCVCKLDVVTFLTMIYKTFASTSETSTEKQSVSTNSVADKKLPKPAKKTKVASSRAVSLEHIPMGVRQFIVRAVFYASLLVVLLKGRMSLNQGEDRQDAHYNRLHRLARMCDVSPDCFQLRITSRSCGHAC